MRGDGWNSTDLVIEERCRLWIDDSLQALRRRKDHPRQEAIQNLTRILDSTQGFDIVHETGAHVLDTKKNCQSA